MKASEYDGKSMQHRLSNFLLTYGSAPHATTNQSPSSLFLKREVRTRFDLLKPDGETQVTAKQAMQKLAHNRKAKLREFTVGQEVMARNYREGDKWVPGVVVERKGPLSYIIQTESGTPNEVATEFNRGYARATVKYLAFTDHSKHDYD